MGLNRYFVPNLPITGSIELSSEEAHHALRVRRETVDGICVAFDGRGHVAICRIIRTTKRDVTIEVESYRFEPNEPSGRIQLAVAMPRGDRQRGVIEKAVELGVHELVPIVCQRSVGLPNDSALEKWERAVVEACKQCERNRLMTISELCSFESFIQSESSDDLNEAGTLRMFAHPQESIFDANEKRISFCDRIDNRILKIAIAIGPEGGFTKDEVKLAIDAGLRRLDLGPRILRVETAVCAASFYASLCMQKKSHDANA